MYLKIIVVLFVWHLHTSTTSSAEIAPRPYEQGPLDSDDFAARVPDDRRGLDAEITTKLNYRYTYRTRGNSESATASVVRMDITAMVDPNRSWNAVPANQHVMDHEQGHFDVAQAIALETRIVTGRAIRQGKLTAIGKTQEEAVAGLKRRVKQAIDPFSRKLQRAQVEYDRRTDHGRITQAQTDERRRQLRRLTQLRQIMAEDQKASKTKPRVVR